MPDSLLAPCAAVSLIPSRTPGAGGAIGVDPLFGVPNPTSCGAKNPDLAISLLNRRKMKVERVRRLKPNK